VLPRRFAPPLRGRPHVPSPRTRTEARPLPEIPTPPPTPKSVTYVPSQSVTYVRLHTVIGPYHSLPLLYGVRRGCATH